MTAGARSGTADKVTACSSVPLESELARDYRSFRETWLERGEREYVQHLLKLSGGVVATAAAAAGLDRTYFYKLMRRHGITNGAR